MDFRRLDVPEIFGEERRRLAQAIDWYRIDRYERADHLKPSRVVFVRGPRGGGKTHLLRSLAFDDSPKLLVRPQHFDPNMPFDEQVLAYVEKGMQEVDEAHGTPFHRDLAESIASRLLMQSILALSPIERIFNAKPTWRQQLLWMKSAPEKLLSRPMRLADALADGADGKLVQIVERFELRPEQCLRIIERRIEQVDEGSSPLAVVRRRLYTALARTALEDHDEAFNDFVSGEDLADVATGMARRDLVAARLHALIECCAAVRSPVVVAFDNLEGLFTDGSEISGAKARAFTRQLAQAIDDTRGILFLVFGEDGLLDREVFSNVNADAFVLDRFALGLPLGGGAPLTKLQISKPSSADVQALIRNRVQDVLEGTAEAEDLPQGFPFDSSDLAEIESTLASSESIRGLMYRIRERYSERVYGVGPPVAAAAVPSESPRADSSAEATAFMTAAWEDALRQNQSDPKLNRILLHAGLGAAIRIVAKMLGSDSSLTSVVDSESLGEDPRYGAVSRATWTAASGDVESIWLLGFLAAGGSGMKADLENKFQALRKVKGPVKPLLFVLWITDRPAENLIEQLPPATAAAWKSDRRRGDARLLKLDEATAKALISVPAWRNRLSDAPSPISDAQREEFLARRLKPLLDDLRSAATDSEATAA